MKSILFIILFFLYFFTKSLSAIELETRIPPSVWEIEIKFKHTPKYNEAFNGFGEKAPLHTLLLWNRDWIENVEGELQREEQMIEISMAFAFAENWLVKGKIPVLQKKQTSTLNFESGSSSQKNVLSNLDSENINGIGDISMQISNDLSYGTTWHNRGGITLRIPTGNSGIPRGTFSNAIGERNSSIGTFFHFTWFPLVHGLRNSFRIQGTNELIGNQRETLDGVESYYAPGNCADIYYNWSIERQNIFVGAEFHYFQQSESKLPTGQSNDSVLKEIKLELGYGNLNDLELKPLILPWQLRLGYVQPISGQNTPFTKSWEFTSVLFF